MKWVLAYFTLLGFNFGFWMLVGIVRFFSDKFLLFGRPGAGKVKITFKARSDAHYAGGKALVESMQKPFLQKITEFLQACVWDFKRRSAITFRFPVSNVKDISIKRELPPHSIRAGEVAALVPAHNEEIVIANTVKSLLAVLPKRNIYVGSDGSEDKTVKIAKSLGCVVLDIRPNRGKAGAIAYTIKRFNLLKKYKAVLIVDADSQVDENYLKRALPLFDDPDIAAVAGHHRSHWEPHLRPQWRMFFVAHRLRLFRILQGIFRYGQTWKYMNVSPIIPGFASIYRTSALKHIDIAAPGLVIEDFNMTFEIHHKRLGKIAYRPGIFGVTHDPYSFRDYIKQIRRWGIGFWQTIKRHGVWLSPFWAALGPFILEILGYGIFVLLLPFILLWFLFSGFEPIAIPFFNGVELTFLDLAVGTFAVDYIMTIVVAYVERKPVMLVYGLGFPFMRYVDAFMAIYTIPLAFFTESSGKWISPKRR